MNKNEVMAKVVKIQRDLKGRDVSAYREYELERHVFHSPRSEDELCRLTGIWLTNGLVTTHVSEVALVYCAYEGILAVALVDDNESYFEFNSGMNHVDHTTEVWTGAILALWDHLKLL